MKLKSIHLTALALALALHSLTLPAKAQAVAGAPAFIDYQGMVFDGTTTDKPLGSSGTPGNYVDAPTNYTMQFKIYDAPSAGNLVWAETQTVTVSLGAFSVRLGLGAAIPGLPHDSLTNAFNGKERYLELTVITSGATGTPITPRLAFQATPFSFVAERAKLADTATVANKVSGVSGSTFTGTVNASGGTFTSGTFGTASSPATFVGTGAGITNLAGGNLQTGTVDVAKLAAAVQQALCPPGTIVAYGGDAAPAGWALCNGASVSRTGTTANLYAAIGTRFGSANSTTFNVPDFRGRFLRGRDGGVNLDPDRASRTAMKAGGATGDSVGSVQGHQFQAHSHEFAKSYTTADTGSGRAVTDWYGAGTNITSPTGGSETRPLNAYVNYIIKL